MGVDTSGSKKKIWNGSQRIKEARGLGRSSQGRGKGGGQRPTYHLNITSPTTKGEGNEKGGRARKRKSEFFRFQGARRLRERA